VVVCRGGWSQHPARRSVAPKRRMLRGAAPPLFFRWLVVWFLGFGRGVVRGAEVGDGDEGGGGGFEMAQGEAAEVDGEAAVGSGGQADMPSAQGPAQEDVFALIG